MKITGPDSMRDLFVRWEERSAGASGLGAARATGEAVFRNACESDVPRRRSNVAREHGEGATSATQREELRPIVAHAAQPFDKWATSARDEKFNRYKHPADSLPVLPGLLPRPHERDELPLGRVDLLLSEYFERIVGFWVIGANLPSACLEHEIERSIIASDRTALVRALQVYKQAAWESCCAASATAGNDKRQ
jgi:hypothetical protein